MKYNCVVCNGTGVVEKDKYPDLKKDNSSENTVPCRTCMGKGYFLVRDSK